MANPKSVIPTSLTTFVSRLECCMAETTLFDREPHILPLQCSVCHCHVTTANESRDRLKRHR